MKNIKEILEKNAVNLGFDDVGFVSAEKFKQNEYDLECEPKNILEDVDTIMLLFKKFAPATAFSNGKITASSYYFASHFAYSAAKELEKVLIGCGIEARHTVKIPVIQAALRYGGSVGQHRLYIHPEFGSTVHIQTILLKEYIRKTFIGEGKSCIGCGKCRKACPTGSLIQHKDELCIHENLTHGDIPDFIKPHIYQLFGCEKCQTACPLNMFGETYGKEYDICDVLEGKCTDELKRLTGKNNARAMRILNQTIIYAANIGETKAYNTISGMNEKTELKDAVQWAKCKLFDD